MIRTSMAQKAMPTMMGKLAIIGAGSGIRSIWAFVIVVDSRPHEFWTVHLYVAFGWFKR